MTVCHARSSGVTSRARPGPTFYRAASWLDCFRCWPPSEEDWTQQQWIPRSHAPSAASHHSNGCQRTRARSSTSAGVARHCFRPMRVIAASSVAMAASSARQPRLELIAVPNWSHRPAVLDNHPKSPDLLKAIAQIAVALAGFSGFIAAIRTFAPEGWHPRDLWSSSCMLGAGIGALLSTGPRVPSCLDTSEPSCPSWFGRGGAWLKGKTFILVAAPMLSVEYRREVAMSVAAGRNSLAGGHKDDASHMLQLTRDSCQQIPGESNA